jgi:hypothetical protein
MHLPPPLQIHVLTFISYSIFNCMTPAGRFFAWQQQIDKCHGQYVVPGKERAG